MSSKSIPIDIVLREAAFERDVFERAEIARQSILNRPSDVVLVDEMHLPCRAAS
jgi:hypothetical protein